MSGVLGIILANKNESSVMATGGQLVYDLRGYRYHVFTSAGQTAPGQPNAVGAAGSFIVQSNDGNKLFDVLCVGGGGAGGVTPSNATGADGGGGGAVADYFNIPITLPAPGTPVAFPVYVGAGGGYAVPTNVGGAVSLGGTQYPLGVSNPLYITTLAQFNSRFGDTPLGYTAVGGAPAGNYPSSQVSSYGRPAGASGNGNPGGADFPLGTRTGGSGGGGAAGTGNIGNPWWPVPAPLLATPSFPPANYYPTPAAQSSGGNGGVGATSTIAQPDAPHGNVFGGGGGGGGGVPNSFPAPVAPGGAGGTGGGGTGGTGGAGPTGYPGTEGGTNTGGGGGGQAAVPSGSVGPYRSGGPGIVVVRYPYP
jgi:hypothetical protein